ncbi:MAG: hypothetical protein ACREIT_02250 [Tepidisphaeraceae bacterium]
MGVHEGRGQLSKAMKELMLHWAETKSSWSDPRGEEFEKKYLEPLEQSLRGAAGAMDQMATLLATIRRDCE